MFVSCAWFFADLAGIEAVQNLAAARRAIDLYAPFTGADPGLSFQEDLEMALSNLPEEGSGSRILEHRVLPMRRGPAFGGALFILADLFRGERPLLDPEEEIALPTPQQPVCGLFRRERLLLQENGAPFPECSGEVSVSLRPGLGTWEATFHLRRRPDSGFELRLYPAGGGTEETCDLSELPGPIRRGILEYLSRGLLAESGLRTDALERGLELIAFSRGLGSPLPIQAFRLGEVALEAAVAETIASLSRTPGQPPDPGELARLRALVLAAREQGFVFDAAGTSRLLSHLATRQIEGLGAAGRAEGDDEERLRSILGLLELAAELGLRPDLTRLQRLVFERLPSAAGPQASGELLVRLAAGIGINVERFRLPARTV